MQASTLFEVRVLFSPNLPEAVNRLLQQAVAATHNDRQRAENLFRQARQLDSACLQTYFALYKFYFYQGRLAEAEHEVISGLEEAARQGGFPNDYGRLASDTRQWNLYASEITLFYLYTLKALAFIKLRRQQETEARQILAILPVLDPEDRCGASVIMSLAEALSEEEL